MSEKLFHNSEEQPGRGYEVVEAEETALMEKTRENIKTIEGPRKMMVLSAMALFGALTGGCATQGQNGNEGFKKFGETFVHALNEVNAQARGQGERIIQEDSFERHAAIGVGAGGSSFGGSSAGISAETGTTEFHSREAAIDHNREIVDETSFKSHEQNVAIDTSGNHSSSTNTSRKTK